MKEIIKILILILITMIGIVKINENFNYNLFGHINVSDWSINTLKHETAHSIYKNLSKEDKLFYKDKMFKEEFLWETYWSYILRELILIDKIYRFQNLINKNKIDEELFAYYVQMKY